VADMSVPQRQRPWPAINSDTEYFWEGVRLGELRVQRCESCAALTHPPRPRCPHCGSFDLGYQVVPGTGTVYSWVVFRHPLAPPYTEPYAVALVELETGNRIVAQLTGLPLGEIRIGLPVTAEFTEVEPGLTLPVFRPVPAAVE
jgi:uncharacterized protein